MLLVFGRLIANLYDFLLDIFYCGHFLQKSVDRKIKTTGYTSSQSCRYFIIESIFKNLSLRSEGNFLEVGCGQGRVLAFLKHKKTKWQLTGIESNPLALKICHQWADNTDITILEKDVFNHNISDYNIFFVGHPFDDNNLSLFIKKIENEVVEKVIVIFVLDIKLGNFISQRKGWSISQRETIYTYHNLPILPHKNRYTIYYYSPNNYDNN